QEKVFIFSLAYFREPFALELSLLHGKAETVTTAIGKEEELGETYELDLGSINQQELLNPPKRFGALSDNIARTMNGLDEIRFARSVSAVESGTPKNPADARVYELGVTPAGSRAVRSYTHVQAGGIPDRAKVLDRELEEHPAMLFTLFR